MKPESNPEPALPQAEAPAVSSGKLHQLEVTAIYQHPVARGWITEWWGRIAQRVGSGDIRVAWWSIGDLAQHKNLADAAQSALRADVIIIALSAVDVLPVDLCRWVDAWLSGRPKGGALVAFLGWPVEKPGRQTCDVEAYLRTVAHKAGLDFSPHERILPARPLAAPGPERASDAASAPG